MIELKRQSNNNIFGLDVLRGLAIILMFITHGFRLYAHHNTPLPTLAYRFLAVFIAIEPFTSALFLFLVGVGLYLSKNNTKKNYKKWLKDNLGKSLILYSLGVLLFLVEYSVQLPDLFLAPNILSAISLAIILISLTCFSIPLMTGISFLIALLALFLEQTNFQFSGLNLGPGGAVPLVLFAYLGYLAFYLKDHRPKLFLALIPLLSISFFIPGAWISIFSAPYSVYSNEGYNLIDYLSARGVAQNTSYEGFWNHSLLSVGRIGVILLVSLILTVRYSNNLKSKIYNQGLALLGRHALGNYILHLSVIGLFAFFKLYPSTPVHTWMFISGLIALGLFYSKQKESKKE